MNNDFLFRPSKWGPPLWFWKKQLFEKTGEVVSERYLSKVLRGCLSPSRRVREAMWRVVVHWATGYPVVRDIPMDYCNLVFGVYLESGDIAVFTNYFDWLASLDPPPTVAEVLGLWSPFAGPTESDYLNAQELLEELLTPNGPISGADVPLGAAKLDYVGGVLRGETESTGLEVGGA